MNIGRWVRTVRALHPLQVVGRPWHVVLSRLVRDVPTGAPPALLEGFPPAPAGLRRFADTERDRFRDRLPRLPEGSALRSYETQYGLELGGSSDGPIPEWRGIHASDAYPASVRARRIAVAARCGRRGLERELARAARAIAAHLEIHLLGNHLLENAIGLVCAASVTHGKESDVWWRSGAALLTWQIDEQFLPDGGHFERSASYHLALTAALLEAIELAQSARRDVPAQWREASRRALQWAATVRAPDGTYPLFNDAALDSAPSIDAVLDLGLACGFATAPPSPPTSPLWTTSLPNTGWILAGVDGRAWLCIDAGPDGAAYQPGHVHADALTFELWVDKERSIVDYGVASYADDAARAATRSTRTHNTVELDGRDSSEVWHAFRVGRRCRSHVRALKQRDDEIEIEVEHDGYSWLPGKPVHRRRVSLRRDRLEIEDNICGSTFSGTSRLHADAKAARRMKITGSTVPRRSASVWHPEFAAPRETIVLEQPVSSLRPCHWTIAWGPIEQR